MAKALFGHVVSTPDIHLVAEVRRLRARIVGLEAENSRLRGENARLLAEIAADDTMSVLSQESGLSHETVITKDTVLAQDANPERTMAGVGREALSSV